MHGFWNWKSGLRSPVPGDLQCQSQFSSPGKEDVIQGNLRGYWRIKGESMGGPGSMYSGTVVPQGGNTRPAGHEEHRLTPEDSVLAY